MIDVNTEANNKKLDLRAIAPKYYTPRSIETRNRLYQDSPCLQKDKIHHVASALNPH